MHATPAAPLQHLRIRGGAQVRALVGGLVAACLVATPTAAAPRAADPGGSDALAGDTAPRAPYQGDLSTIGLVAGGVDFQIEDDAVYMTNRSNYPVLFRDPLTTTAAGTYVGASTSPGAMAAQSTFHAHGGSVAYSRWNDKHLVIADSDGTTTVPDWATTDEFTYGVLDLDDSWVAGSGTSARGLYNRRTGVRVPLESLASTLSGYSVRVSEIAVSETRVVWSVFGGTDSTAFTGLYTVALDPTDADGAVGSATQLAATTHPRSTGAETTYVALDTDCALLAWVRQEWAGDTLTSQALDWQRSAPYTGTAAERAMPTTDHVLGVDGTVVVVERDEPSWHADWYDLAGAGTTPIRSLDMWGRGEAADARFLLWDIPQDGTTMMSDVTGGALSVVAVPTRLFSDVGPGDPFYAAIFRLNERHVTGGYPDGTFRPRASVNRDAMAAFLYRMQHIGEPAPACTQAPFTDVPVSHPFCGEIAWLASTGITTGYPDGTYRPGEPVTREAMAAFLYRFAMGHAGRAPACAAAPFSDVPASHPFCGEISWLARGSITSGWPDGTFRPGLTIERQAMAAFLHRGFM